MIDVYVVDPSLSDELTRDFVNLLRPLVLVFTANDWDECSEWSAKVMEDELRAYDYLWYDGLASPIEDDWKADMDFLCEESSGDFGRMVVFGPGDVLAPRFRSAGLNPVVVS